jgi:hypothetical protein
VHQVGNWLRSHQYVTDSVCDLLSCWIKGEPGPLSQEDSATATKLSIPWTVYNRGLWPSHSHHNLYNPFPVGHVKT